MVTSTRWNQEVANYETALMVYRCKGSTGYLYLDALIQEVLNKDPQLTDHQAATEMRELVHAGD